MARITDSDLLDTEYADESRLETRFRVFTDQLVDLDYDAEICSLLGNHTTIRAPGARVLEIGSGTGRLAARIVSSFPQAEFTATDRSPRMVEVARAAGVPAQVADAMQLPFTHASFDVVVANMMLYHLPDIDHGLAELARVLRPGGALLATTFGHGMLEELYGLLPDDGSRPEMSFRQDTARELLSKSFTDISAHTITGTVRFPHRADAVEHMESTLTRAHLAEHVPAEDAGMWPLDATLHVAAYVARSGMRG